MMIPSYLARIGQLRGTIASALATDRNPVTAAVSDVSRQAVAEALGAVSQYLTGLRRPGQRIGRIAVDANRTGRRKKLELEARQSALDLLNEITLASDLGLEDPIDWKFLRHVRGQAAKARSAKGALTILDRAEGIVHELSAYSTPEDDFSVIRGLDRKFRAFIRERLSTRGGDWWGVGVPLHLQRKVDKSRISRGVPQADPLKFLAFGDYSAIILSQSNWAQIFFPLLGDRSQFESRMNRLVQLRNDIAHSRPLSTASRVELRELAKHIIPDSP
jgi:hypothetical protein